MTAPLQTQPRLASRPPVETSSYAAFIRRAIRAYGRRVARGEPADLPALEALREVVDEALAEAVAGLRSEAGGSYSWQAIADPLGVTRQAAAARWHHAGGARRPGGQPGGLR
jgi:hypothetical protein